MRVRWRYCWTRARLRHPRFSRGGCRTSGARVSSACAVPAPRCRPTSFGCPMATDSSMRRPVTLRRVARCSRARALSRTSRCGKLVKRCLRDAIWWWRLRMNGFARRSASLCGAGVFACVLSLAAPVKLPSAGQILDRYVAVTGGAAAWQAKRTERDEIEGLTLDGLRVVLRATVTVSRPGNSLSEIQVPQNASEGIYKGVAWASSHFSGVRIKPGMEREEAIRDARMLEEAGRRDLYPKSQLAGSETVGQERCYKVLLHPSPTQKIEWFSVSTGL